MNQYMQRCFVPGRGISTPRKPNSLSRQVKRGNSREKIPFIREGARQIPVQAIYEDSVEPEKT